MESHPSTLKTSLPSSQLFSVHFIDIGPIHSLRAEGDKGKEEVKEEPVKISIHSLRAEGDIIIKRK